MDEKPMKLVAVNEQYAVFTGASCIEKRPEFFDAFYFTSELLKIRTAENLLRFLMCKNNHYFQERITNEDEFEEFANSDSIQDAAGILESYGITRSLKNAATRNKVQYFDEETYSTLVKKYGSCLSIANIYDLLETMSRIAAFFDIALIAYGNAPNMVEKEQGTRFFDDLARIGFLELRHISETSTHMEIADCDDRFEQYLAGDITQRQLAQMVICDYSTAQIAHQRYVVKYDNERNIFTREKAQQTPAEKLWSYVESAIFENKLKRCVICGRPFPSEKATKPGQFPTCTQTCRNKVNTKGGE